MNTAAQQNAAYLAGKAARAKGRPRTMCPYASGSLREAWLVGWDEQPTKPGELS